MPNRRNAVKSVINRNYPNINARITPTGIKFTLSPNKARSEKVSNRNTNAYAVFKNRGNTLYIAEMWTNDNYAGRGFQTRFLNAAMNAARKSGYRRMNANSVHVPPYNSLPRMPPSSFIFHKLKFKKNTERGTPGTKNHYIKWVKNL